MTDNFFKKHSILKEKPAVKFFEVYLNNDLDTLFNFLIDLEQKILTSGIQRITKEDIESVSKYDGSQTTMLAHKYNLFEINNKELNNLNNSLLNLTKNACEYYGCSFDNLNYQIKSWFNVSSNDFENKTIPEDSFDKDIVLHHDDEPGAPDLHGYYCVNAEPSVTLYKIDNKLFINKNINNRAILCETNLDHGRGYWKENKKRITVGYHIAPKCILDETVLNRYVPLVYKS